MDDSQQQSESLSVPFRCIYSGSLLKRTSGKHEWEARYCVVVYGIFAYFRTQEKAEKFINALPIQSEETSRNQSPQRYNDLYFPRSHHIEGFRHVLKYQYPPRGYIKLLNRHGEPVSSVKTNLMENNDNDNNDKNKNGDSDWKISIIHKNRQFDLKCETKESLTYWFNAFDNIGIKITSYNDPNIILNNLNNSVNHGNNNDNNNNNNNSSNNNNYYLTIASMQQKLQRQYQENSDNKQNGTIGTTKSSTNNTSFSMQANFNQISELEETYDENMDNKENNGLKSNSLQREASNNNNNTIENDTTTNNKSDNNDNKIKIESPNCKNNNNNNSEKRKILSMNNVEGGSYVNISEINDNLFENENMNDINNINNNENNKSNLSKLDVQMINFSLNNDEEIEHVKKNLLKMEEEDKQLEEEQAQLLKLLSMDNNKILQKFSHLQQVFENQTQNNNDNDNKNNNNNDIQTQNT